MPNWFKRVAATFDEVLSHVGSRPCSESPTDLLELELFESFLHVEGREDIERVREEDESFSLDTETVFRLKGLLRHSGREMRGDAVSDDVQQRIRLEVEAASVVLACDACSDEFKCRLMSLLQERGFNAGVCKSKWEKTSGFPPGEYSFVDVDVHGVRYIVESDLSRQFEMARCTEQYRLLLDMIPPVFVGRGDKLKQLVRIMCSAQKRSMRKMDMHIPPWRRKGYMLSKWFGPQERSTTGDVRAREAPRLGGYFSYYCREDCSSKTEIRDSLLKLGFHRAPQWKQMI